MFDLEMNRRQIIIGGVAVGAAGLALFVRGGETGVMSCAEMFRNWEAQFGSLGCNYCQGSLRDERGDFPLDHLPPPLRKVNRDGSCVHCTTYTYLRGMGHHRSAEFWWQHYRRGEYASRHAKRMDAAGFDYAVTTRGNPEFLDNACGNRESARRGAGITLLAAHMVLLCDLDPATFHQPNGYYLNNWVSNWDRSIGTRMGRRALLSDWQRRSGWAWTIFRTPEGVCVPPPPRFS